MEGRDKIRVNDIFYNTKLCATYIKEETKYCSGRKCVRADEKDERIEAMEKKDFNERILSEITC